MDYEILHEKRQKGEAPEEKRGMPGVTFMACGVRQHSPGLYRELLLEVSLMSTKRCQVDLFNPWDAAGIPNFLEKRV